MTDDEGSVYYKDGWAAGYAAGRADAAAAVLEVDPDGSCSEGWTAIFGRAARGEEVWPS